MVADRVIMGCAVGLFPLAYSVLRDELPVHRVVRAIAFFAGLMVYWVRRRPVARRRPERQLRLPGDLHALRYEMYLWPAFMYVGSGATFGRRPP